MAPDTRPDTDSAPSAVARELGFARRLLKRVGGRLALAFLCIALPLWTLGELAEDVAQGESFAFDEPLLRLAQAAAGPEADGIFLVLSAVGFAWGVIPADMLLVGVLVLRNRFREATFLALATGGAGLLNFAAKHTFRRERPSLWESIAPEATYSFPSGHAMASSALAAALVALAWSTRLRIPVLGLALGFVLAVGMSRVYLGVHYPSDIVAGWCASVLWVAAVYAAAFRGERRPWAAT